MRYLLTAIFALALAAPTPGHSVLSLDVTPRHAYHYSIYSAAEFTYFIRTTAIGPVWLCHGWEYPIVQLDATEWPYRRSCSYVDRKIVERQWGGRRWPLPFIGEYRAFAELYTSPEAVRPEIRVETPFRVLEGIPRS